MRASVLAVVATAFALVVAGCGGAEQHYSFRASLPCLNTVSRVTRPAVDVTNIGRKDALRLDFPDGNAAAVAFETSVGAAEHDRKAFAQLFDSVGLEGLADRYGTVALLWDRVPTAVQTGAVKSCLAA